MRTLLFVLLLSGCASTPRGNAPWEKCTFGERGATSPEALARVAWAGGDVSAYRVEQCEAFALVWASLDTKLAAEIRQRTGRDLIDGLADLDRTRALPSGTVVAATRCSLDDYQEDGPCSSVTIPLDGDVIMDVRAIAVGDRWFFADEVRVARTHLTELRAARAELEAIAALYPRAEDPDVREEITRRVFDLRLKAIEGEYLVQLNALASEVAETLEGRTLEQFREDFGGAPRYSESCSDSLAEGSVTKTGPYDYSVDVAAVSTLFANGDIDYCARVVPHYVDNNYQGFKFVGVRPGSVLRLLGIRSGDIITRIDGDAIDSPDRVKLLYERLRDEPTVTIDIERRGMPKTIVWTKRGPTPAPR